MLDFDLLQQRFTSRYPNHYYTVDSHTQGEPTRLLLGGSAEPAGATMEQKRQSFMDNFDYLRLLLTSEPRGHRDMFAAAVTEPVSSGADFGLIYMDARRYPYLCGHGTIGAVTVMVELGLLDYGDGDHTILIDTPSGTVQAHTRIHGGRVESVGIDMVPSFVYKTCCPLDLGSSGEIEIDLVYAGGFFAMISASSHGIDLKTADRSELVRLGMAVIEAANSQLTVHHPQRPEVKTVDVAEFHQEKNNGEKSGSGVVIYGEAHMDRSPCGTGTTAKMTLLHHQGRLEAGESYANSSPLGTVFTGRIIEETEIGGFPSIVCRIRASAVITGCHRFVLDSRDPFPTGFLL